MLDSTVSTSTVSVESAETLALREKRKAQKIEAKASAKRASNSVKRDAALGVAVKPSKTDAVNASPADAGELVQFFDAPSYGTLIEGVMSGIDATSATSAMSKARRLACAALFTLSTVPNLDKTHKTALTSLCLSARVSHGGLLTAVNVPKGTVLPATSETALSILRYVHRVATSTRATVEATRAKKAEAEAEAARLLAEQSAVNSAALVVVKDIINALKLSKAQKTLLASMTDAQWSQFSSALRASL